MFRGIDPEGLAAVANMTEQKTSAINRRTPAALELLGRHQRHLDANRLGAAISALSRWGVDSGANLRWRADSIRAGQQAGHNPLSLLRAQFAAEGLFSLDAVDTAYRDWVEQIQSRDERVDAAVADISSWLSQGLTDWDVSNGDLHNIQTTLVRLNGDKLDRVIARLSPTQLERWIGEMGHRFNGFSRNEKGEVFASLARNASGDTLGRVHDAIVSVGRLEDIDDFGTAIQTHAGDTAIVQFVTYAVDSGLPLHRFSAVAPAMALAGLDSEQAIDSAARSVVAAEDALAVLIIDCHLMADGGDSTTADTVIWTLIRSTDIETRSALFALMTTMGSDRGRVAELVAARHPSALGTRQADAERRELVSAITSECLVTATEIISDDANRVIQALATDLDRDGTLLTTYWGLLTTAGQGGTIASILAELRGGDAVKPAEFSRIGPDPAYSYPHARNLAYTAATLNLAFTAHADGAKGDIEAISRLAGVVVAAAGLLSGVGDIAAGVIGISADWEVAAAATTTKQGIDEELAKLIDLVTARLRPLESAPPVADGAADAWTDVYLQMMPFA